MTRHVVWTCSIVLATGCGGRLNVTSDDAPMSGGGAESASDSEGEQPSSDGGRADQASGAERAGSEQGDDGGYGAGGTE